MPLPTAFSAVPDWFSWENPGVDAAVGDITGSGRPDLLVLMVDDGPCQNRAAYRIGRDLDVDGVVTGGWTAWIDVPDWFSWANQGAGIDVFDLSGSGRPDLVVLAVDNPPGRNQAFYRIGTDLDPDGVAADWSTALGISNWFSWENQGAGVAVADLGAGPTAIGVAVDAPPGANTAFTVAIALRADPAVHGTWEVLPYDSQVLAIHAALLRTGHVLFFAGSGKYTVRVADLPWGRHPGHLDERGVGSGRGHVRQLRAPGHAAPGRRATVRLLLLVGTRRRRTARSSPGAETLPTTMATTSASATSRPSTGEPVSGRLDRRRRAVAGTRRCCRLPTGASSPSAGRTTPMVTSTPSSGGTTPPPTSGCT